MHPVNDSPSSTVEANIAGRAEPRRWWTVVQIVLPIAILAGLFWHMLHSHPDAMRDLWQQPKSTPGIVLSTLLVFAAVSISFLRWFLLVAALRLPFTVRDAFRLGFMGYFMNFVSAGGVGGDLFKAAFMIRDQPTRRSAALATIVLDRFLGLYALLLLVCLVVAGVAIRPDDALADWIRWLPLVTVIATGLGGLVLAVAGSDNPISRRLRHVPWMTTIIHDLLLTAYAYRTKKRLCVAALLLSLLVHSCVATAHAVLAWSLFGDQGPTFHEHLVMTPLAHAAAGLPLTPGGLGTYEVALTYLFEHYPQHSAGSGRGFAVALGYRLQTLLVAGVGMVYCYWYRRKVKGQLLAGKYQLG